MSYKNKLARLRAAMSATGVDGYIVPRMDRYMGEFVAPDAERLAWLTGFTGSAGTAVILADRACVFSDGRYTIQLAQQVDKTLYVTEDNTKIPVSQWLAAHAQPGSVIGFDPWLLTPAQFKAIQKVLDEKSIKLKALEGNLLDPLWVDRPPAPRTPVSTFPEVVAGSSAAEKKSRIEQILKDKNLFACVLNMPDSLCWLLNVRGSDIDTTPVVLSMGIVHAAGEKISWFVEKDKLSAEVAGPLQGVAEVMAPAEMTHKIDQLAKAAKQAGQAIGLDYARAPAWFWERLRAGGAEVADCKDPCILPRAIKTVSEQKSIRAAHVADGVAIVKFLHWLESAAKKDSLNELLVEEQLEFFRKQNPDYQGPSFATIAGWGPNGAIVHYRATPETNLSITPPGLLLLDSGGQYHYGTTDITRTMAIGAPTADMRRHYTLVLKGHVAVSCAVFAPGTNGTEIDLLARAPLKAEGLDYAHGTGHGVGCYLSVHQESASISARGAEPLMPGMLLSNEPGYYRENAYGIRIENLVLVQEQGASLGFETVTLAPYDRALIDTVLLSAAEKNWINDYHAHVLQALSPYLDAAHQKFLHVACEPL